METNNVENKKSNYNGYQVYRPGQPKKKYYFTPLIIHERILDCNYYEHGDYCRCSINIKKTGKSKKKKISFLCLAEKKSIEEFAETYNNFMMEKNKKNLNQSDQATLFLPMTYESLFRQRNKDFSEECWGIIPKQQKYMVYMIKDIIRNIIDVYHEIYMKYENSIKQLTNIFKNNCKKIRKQLQPKIYFAPNFDFMGVSNGYENKIKENYTIHDKNSRKVYQYTFIYYIPRWDEKKRAFDCGFLGHILDLLYNNPDKAILLQLLFPDGSVCQWINDRYLLYSDIAIGLTARGSCMDGESIEKTCIRETYEESGGAIDLRKWVDRIKYIDTWGDIDLYTI